MGLPPGYRFWKTPQPIHHFSDVPEQFTDNHYAKQWRNKDPRKYKVRNMIRKSRKFPNVVEMTLETELYSCITMFDFDDLPFAQSHLWRVSRFTNTCYAITEVWDPILKKNITGKFHKMLTKYDITDHINRNGLDNRKSNLRSTNSQQNNANSTCPNSKREGKFPGVSKTKHHGKDVWQTSIMVNCKNVGFKRFYIDRLGERNALRMACKHRKWLCEKYGNGNDYPIISDSDSEPDDDSQSRTQLDIRMFLRNSLT